ncbi:MAG: hypothetical protein HQL39_08550 [Alphaproteobacteria bacterium]|nr:hypothetical protein [Alphaproteobacteria bacterium]
MERSDKDEILAAIGQMAARMDGLESKVDRLSTKIDAVGDRVTRVEGQMSIIVSWMQSMDQRVTALMHPYEPRKPAAE